MNELKNEALETQSNLQIKTYPELQSVFSTVSSMDDVENIFNECPRTEDRIPGFDIAMYAKTIDDKILLIIKKNNVPNKYFITFSLFTSYLLSFTKDSTATSEEEEYTEKSNANYFSIVINDVLNKYHIEVTDSYRVYSSDSNNNASVNTRMLAYIIGIDTGSINQSIQPKFGYIPYQSLCFRKPYESNLLDMEYPIHASTGTYETFRECMWALFKLNSEYRNIIKINVYSEDYRKFLDDEIDSNSIASKNIAGMISYEILNFNEKSTKVTDKFRRTKGTKKLRDGVNTLVLNFNPIAPFVKVEDIIQDESNDDALADILSVKYASDILTKHGFNTLI